MLKTTVHILIGLLLSGCSFNDNRKIGTFYKSYTITVAPDDTDPVIPTFPAAPVVIAPVIETKPTDTVPPPTVPTTPPQARPEPPRIPAECRAYTPLPFPALVEVDLDKLQKSKTYKDVNALLSENITDLHEQIKQYRDNTRNHYKKWLADWNKHCKPLQGKTLPGQ